MKLVKMIPFSSDQFLNVFVQYNLAVWPAQSLLLILGLTAVGLALPRTRDFSHGISFILTLLWLWTGLVYHGWFFTTVNNAAWLFATLFVLQAFLFMFSGISKEKLKFRFRVDIYGITGGIFLLYALLVYPALGHFLGHRYPAAPTFGVPCPITIFTFGLLLWTDRKIPLYIAVIPTAWSLLGFWAATSLGMTEDYGVLAAGLIGSLLIILRNKPAPLRFAGFESGPS